MNKRLTFAVAFGLFGAAMSSAQAATFEWRTTTTGITVNGNSLSQTVDGITVEVRGYVAELGFQADNPDGYSDATVIGPFPTSSDDARLRPFGIDLRDLGGEQLGLNVDPEPGADASGSDFGGGGVAPGFDSGPYRNLGEFNNRFEKFDFAVFSFSAPVDIGSVIVDDTTNFGRAAWFATGSTAPDFSTGFLNSLSAFDILNSPDVPSDGLLEHVIGATDISYMMVGAPPRSGLGSLTEGSSQFYIDSFGATLSEGETGGDGGNGVSPVPVAPALPLLATALISFGLLTRRKPTA